MNAIWGLFLLIFGLFLLIFGVFWGVLDPHSPPIYAIWAVFGVFWGVLDPLLPPIYAGHPQIPLYMPQNPPKPPIYAAQAQILPQNSPKMAQNRPKLTLKPPLAPLYMGFDPKIDPKRLKIYSKTINSPPWMRKCLKTAIFKGKIDCFYALLTPKPHYICDLSRFWPQNGLFSGYFQLFRPHLAPIYAKLGHFRAISGVFHAFWGSDTTIPPLICGSSQIVV